MARPLSRALLLAMGLIAGTIGPGAVPIAQAQGTIPGLTSTPINFSGHADAFVAGPDGHVWLLDSTRNQVGRLAVDGSAYQAFAVPTASAGLQSIVVGPDGNLWFTEASASKVGRITPSGTITEFTVPASFHFVFPVSVATGSIASGPDGNLWIGGQNQMAKITPQGAVTVLALTPPAGASLIYIGKCVTGSDRNFWCLGNVLDHSGFNYHTVKLTTGGAVTAYPGQFQSFDIIEAPDGNVWYVSQQEPIIPPHSLTRITPAGVETVYALPTQTFSEGLAVGADGNLWFTERSTMGNIWQMVLSTATDDGHATFNSAPITTSYPEGIIAVTSPTATSGVHTEQASKSCPAGEAFYVGTSTDYGANVTWIRTAAPTTCTDLTAFASSSRYSNDGSHKTFWGCYDQIYSPDFAEMSQIQVRFPLFTTVSSVDRANWDSCDTTTPAGAGPIVTCRVNFIKPFQYAIAFIAADYEGLDPVVITCTSTTPEIYPPDNTYKLYSLDVILAPAPTPPSPPVKIDTRW